MIDKRLDKHLTRNSLHDICQSAYRCGHSTETALLRVHNDIVNALDKNHMVILIMLDLSAAFDVIDHKLLIRRFKYSYGIRSKALDWIKSYLNKRSQSVIIENEKSVVKQLNFSVPQGSVLGPKKYCMFSRPIGNIAKQHGLQYHCYADDTQIYVAISQAASWVNTAKRIEACISDISKWMKMNMLKLNEEKTEFIVFRPTKLDRISLDMSLLIGPTTITPSSCVKNLGVYFDSYLTMEKHVNEVSKACYYQIRNIWKIRHYLTDAACKTLVQSLVISRLDYGNALLYGLPQTLIKRLQLVQNSAARLVTLVRKHDHITPSLIDLHWLPVPQRSKYKIIMYTFKAIQGLAPPYINELINKYHQDRLLRSESKSLLSIPITNTSTYGNRCYTNSAARMWNSLPDGLKDIKSLPTFKKHLKTHLFEETYLP